MGVFTFVCKNSGGEWSAKQHSGDLEASSSCTYELQRKLVKAALANESGGVQSSFSWISPSSAVFQVIVGGGGFVGGAVAASSGSAAPAAEAPAAEEKKVEEEESDDDMNLDIFG
ncbi:hypothetical protein GIB67_027949 [Kingdonia uniflora]|uniref:60S acidic ribosomal protein P3 n=1 Tax=Kingdonia uniflora TaxID=39325 RepID=A0A7J7LGH5_9MAGN|nr:hypothetical protein GIB67_027949 [Kingdonia uniflora]